jgi:hypothetical protein
VNDEPCPPLLLAGGRNGRNFERVAGREERAFRRSLEPLERTSNMPLEPGLFVTDRIARVSTQPLSAEWRIQA